MLGKSGLFRIASFRHPDSLLTKHGNVNIESRNKFKFPLPRFWRDEFIKMSLGCPSSSPSPLDWPSQLPSHLFKPRVLTAAGSTSSSSIMNSISTSSVDRSISSNATMTTQNRTLSVISPKEEGFSHGELNIDYAQAKPSAFLNVRFILECCKKLECDALAAATAAQLFHHFMSNVDITDYDPYLIGAACIYLSGKIEGSDILKIRDVINVVHATLHPKSEPLVLDNRYYSIRESITQAELLVVRMAGFNAKFDHAHKYLLSYLKSLSDWVGPQVWNELPVNSVAWSLVQDVYHDRRVLLMNPSDLAIACIKLAMEVYGVEIPGYDEVKNPWFQVFSSTISMGKIWEIMGVLMEVYDQDKALIPPMLRKSHS